MVAGFYPRCRCDGYASNVEHPNPDCPYSEYNQRTEIQRLRADLASAREVIVGLLRTHTVDDEGRAPLYKKGWLDARRDATQWLADKKEAYGMTESQGYLQGGGVGGIWSRLRAIERRLDALEAEPELATIEREDGCICFCYNCAESGEDDFTNPDCPIHGKPEPSAPDRSESLIQQAYDAWEKDPGGTEDGIRAAIRAVADWLVMVDPYGGGDGAGGWAAKALRAELEDEP